MPIDGTTLPGQRSEPASSVTGGGARAAERSIRLEASTICQLRCPCCPTTRGEIREALGSGYLTLEQFRRVVDGSGVEHVELANWGEVLLNPHLPAILAHAAQVGIRLTIDGGANLNHLPPALAEALVVHRLHRLTCAIDGATQETYATYRRGGDLARVLANVDAINAAKAQHGSHYPILRWQFIVFGHNEHEIAAARAMATARRMEIVFKLNWADDYAPVRDPAGVKAQTGLDAATRAEHHQLHGEHYRQKLCCAQLWNMPAINWDGRVLGCSVNRWGDFGIVEDDLEAALNGEKLTYARRMLLGQAAPRPDVPCTSCHNYARMGRDQRWLTAEHIERMRHEMQVAT